MNAAYLITKEADLASAYADIIQPFWQQKMTQSTFIGVGDVEIAYAFVLHPEAIGTVVISTGRIESFVKYKEVIYDLYQNGYSVFVHDHRGQGLSGRMLDNRHIGYVTNFDEYLDDFKRFMDLVVLKQTQHKPKLLCHSMGGAVGTLMVLRYPELFERAAFSAPMFGIRPALPNWFANFLFSLHAKFTQSNAYFFGQKNYENEPFAGNNLTQSEIRYQLFRQEYQSDPSVQLGGVSGHWLKMAALAMDEIEQNAHSFAIPALAIQAGADQIIDNKRQSRVLEKMANTEVMVVEGSQHELLEEQDKYRVPSFSAILDFFGH